jgi:hypothetical protein
MNSAFVRKQGLVRSALAPRGTSSKEAPAASTYDHLEAEAAMTEAERLARELSEERSVIASLRAQPAL